MKPKIGYIRLYGEGYKGALSSLLTTLRDFEYLAVAPFESLEADTEWRKANGFSYGDGATAYLVIDGKIAWPLEEPE